MQLQVLIPIKNNTIIIIRTLKVVLFHVFFCFHFMLIIIARSLTSLLKCMTELFTGVLEQYQLA